MSASSLKILCRYQYDPLDRLMGVGLLERASTQRFYQEDHLTTELDEQTQRTIIRHEAQPLAQQQSTSGVTETSLLATDQSHSLLQTLGGTNPQQMAYTAYGHHPAESGLSRLLGFNGECPDAITGHYLLGQGKRAFNPVLMRFNSPDELSPFGKGGINPYSYCGNDPINHYDPTGNVRLKIVNQHGRFHFFPPPPSPQNTIRHSSSTIARPGRSASSFNPVAVVPIANPQTSSELITLGGHISSNTMRGSSGGNLSPQQVDLKNFEVLYDLNKLKPDFKTVSTQDQFNRLKEIKHSIHTTKNNDTREQIREEIRATFLQIKKTSAINYSEIKAKAIRK